LASSSRSWGFTGSLQVNPPVAAACRKKHQPDGLSLFSRMRGKPRLAFHNVHAAKLSMCQL
jgi:hypothetical protein